MPFRRRSRSRIFRTSRRRNKDDYAGRVDRRLPELVSEGWFLPEYVNLVQSDVKAAEIP